MSLDAIAKTALVVSRPKRKRAFKLRIYSPPEKHEQRAFARWLTYAGYVYIYVPNDTPLSAGKASVQFRNAPNEGWRWDLLRRGMKSGFPDYLVFGLRQDKKIKPLRIVVEMKRQDGGQVSARQNQWHELLRLCGWQVAVCKGAQEAINFVTKVDRETD